jgi:hypothetical protein
MIFGSERVLVSKLPVTRQIGDVPYSDSIGKATKMPAPQS